jgi:hypothetical protein
MSGMPIPVPEPAWLVQWQLKSLKPETKETDPSKYASTLRFDVMMILRQ